MQAITDLFNPLRPKAAAGGADDSPGDDGDDKAAAANKGDGFGSKTIGFGGGCCLLWNNITGPGMVSLMLIYQSAGWLPATLLFVGVGIMSGMAAGFVSESMTLVEGNDRFQGRVEMMFLAQELLPRLVYLTTIFFFVFNLQITNISAIIA